MHVHTFPCCHCNNNTTNSNPIQHQRRTKKLHRPRCSEHLKLLKGYKDIPDNNVSTIFSSKPPDRVYKRRRRPRGEIQLSQTTLGATLDTVWLRVHNQHILAALLLLQECSRNNGKLRSQPLSTRGCVCVAESASFLAMTDRQSIPCMRLLLYAKCGGVKRGWYIMRDYRVF